MNKSKVVRDISQIKKCPLHVCGQECSFSVLGRTLNLSDCFKAVGLRHFKAHCWLQDDLCCCTLTVPSLPTWAVLCTHHPALPRGVNPNFTGLRLQGLSQPWAGLVGNEPHRSAVLGTEALSTHQHLLLSASAWWFMEWESNSQPSATACRAPGAPWAGPAHLETEMLILSPSTCCI